MATINFPHSQADKFLKMTQSEMGMYKDQRHIMFLMGNDFHYAKAKQVWTEMENKCWHSWARTS